MAAPIVLSVAVAVISILALGFHDILTNFEENKCYMTYMFEMPNYKKIPFKETETEFPHYGLYVYGEGKYFQKLRNYEFDGIPVLFIPGNAGSHRQVRSLGSVALRKSEDRSDGIHFNYFATDFNEELSGLSGAILKKQTEYIQKCIPKILSFYSRSKSPPKSVVLVGHSMGGFIARALFTMPGFDPSTVHTIITQATPHQRLLSFVDSDIASFYNSVNEFWKANAGNLQHVTLVSTGGGHRDVQVRYDLTSLAGIAHPSRSISVSTTAVPKSWVSTDHLCAVWCRQMVFVTKRALFDLIDLKTRKISEDPEFRMKVLQHHFVSNNGLEDYLTHEENKTISLDPKIKWETKDAGLWRVQMKKAQSAKYIAMPILLEEGRDSVLLLTNLTNGEWVCYCDIPQGQERCSKCTSLSDKSRLLPSASASKYLRVSNQDIVVTNDTHIVVLIPKGAEMVSVQGDRYNMDQRHLVYQMPNTYDSIISYPISVTDGAAMLRVSNGSSFYSLHLAGLALPTNNYFAKVIPMGCKKHHAESSEGSILRLNVPWSNEETYGFAGYNKEVSLPIKLQSGRPVQYDWREDSMEPHLEMFLHPYCHYQVRLLVSTKDTLGQAARFYGLLLPGFFLVVWMMTLRGVIAHSSKFQATFVSDSSPSDALFEYGKPHYIVPAVFVVRLVIGFVPVAKLLSKLGVPRDDADLLAEQNIWFRLLPLFLYLAAWMFSYAHAFLAHHLMALLSYIGKLFPSALTRLLSPLRLVLCVLAILSCFLCGSIGIFVSNFLLILNVLHILRLISCNLDTKETHRSFIFFFSLMMILTWTCLDTMPSLIIWIKHLVVTKQLHPLASDPTRISGFVITICVTILLGSSVVKPSKFQGEVIGWSLYILSVLTLLFAMDSIYRIPLFTSPVFILAVIPNVIALVSRRVSPKADEGKVSS